jgi:Transposase DDE domain group 1
VFFHQGAARLAEGALRTEQGLAALRTAAPTHLSPAGQLQVATALARAWKLAVDAAPAADGGSVTVDIDATIVTAHSGKEQASRRGKKAFGFRPMAAFADHGLQGNGEPLAILLRPGNAGSNTAADHVEATRIALSQLPGHLRRRVLIRSDSSGGTHEFLTWLTTPGRRLHYSVGFTMTGEVCEAEACD